MEELAEQIKELKDEIEKLTDTISKGNLLLQNNMLQNAALYKEALEPIKTYLRIIVDQYQEDKGLDKILINGGDDGVHSGKLRPAKRK